MPESIKNKGVRLDTRQSGSEQGFLCFCSAGSCSLTLCPSSFAFLVSFLIMVTIYLTDDRRPAEGGVRLAYKQDFKIAGTEKDFRAY